MDFKKATDRLFDHVGHSELAESLGVSVASIRQARLDRTAKAFRSPPPNWERAVAHLANAQIERMQGLLSSLKESV
jgi:hypothetical protein